MIKRTLFSLMVLTMGSLVAGPQAHAGIVTFFGLFFFPPYLVLTLVACASPNRFACGVFVTLGDEHPGAAESMNYLSPDHALVTEGMVAKNGRRIQLTEEERLAHNADLDLYSDIVSEVSGRLTRLSSERVENVPGAILGTVKEVLVEHDARVTTPVQASALAKFVELRFGVSVKQP